jgi:hypothetical protein
MAKGNNQYTNPWISKDDNMLRNNFNITLKGDLISMLPHRSWNSIMIRGSLLNLSRPNHFSAKEIELIKKNYFDMPKSQLKGLLNPCRSWGSVYQKAHTLGLKRNQTLVRSGSDNPAWVDGSSFKPYTSNFNRPLRRSIRERDNYTCQLCGKYKSLRENPAVHHIDYKKRNLNPMNLICLCRKCHGLTVHPKQRIFWKLYFQQRMKERFRISNGI